MFSLIIFNAPRRSIGNNQYAIPYQADGRKIYKIGVNFDSTTRTIGDWTIAEE